MSVQNINHIINGKQCVTTANLKAGGVAFYSGSSSSPAATEARKWVDAIINDTDPVVLPEQACVVSQILEAIYVSSQTGKAVYFE